MVIQKGSSDVSLKFPEVILGVHGDSEEGKFWELVGVSCISRMVSQVSFLQSVYDLLE